MSYKHSLNNYMNTPTNTDTPHMPVRRRTIRIEKYQYNAIKPRLALPYL